MKKLLIGVIAVLATAGLAMGSAFSVPQVTDAVAGQTVVVPISATGAANIVGLNLTLEVAAPLEIVGMDLNGSVYDGNNTGLQAILYPEAPTQQVAMAQTTTNTGTVTLPGLLANVSIKVPDGTAEGDYFFRTTFRDFGIESDFAGVAVDGQGTGMIHVGVVPEPATALLALLGLPMLRRRRA